MCAWGIFLQFLLLLVHIIHTYIRCLFRAKRQVVQTYCYHVLPITGDSKIHYAIAVPFMYWMPFRRLNMIRACTGYSRIVDNTCKKIFLSRPPETKFSPSGSQAHAVTVSLWCLNICRHAPVWNCESMTGYCWTCRIVPRRSISAPSDHLSKSRS